MNHMTNVLTLFEQVWENQSKNADRQPPRSSPPILPTGSPPDQTRPI